MDKVYAGQGKIKTFDWGEVTSLLLFLGDIDKLKDIAEKNGGALYLDIKERKEPSAKGYTHYGEVFLPEKKDDEPRF